MHTTSTTKKNTRRLEVSARVQRTADTTTTQRETADTTRHARKAKQNCAQCVVHGSDDGLSPHTRAQHTHRNTTTERAASAKRQRKTHGHTTPHHQYFCCCCCWAVVAGGCCLLNQRAVDERRRSPPRRGRRRRRLVHRPNVRCIINQHARTTLKTICARERKRMRAPVSLATHLYAIHIAHMLSTQHIYRWCCSRSCAHAEIHAHVLYVVCL